MSLHLYVKQDMTNNTNTLEKQHRNCYSGNVNFIIN